MSYKKIVVDNLTCKRRFHISFDEAEPAQTKVEARCQHCNAMVYSRKNHPPLRIVREENLVNTTSLSSLQTSACNFTLPNSSGPEH
jgi:DNA-directed RNA polymerase subunit RPC12/RpoP